MTGPIHVTVTRGDILAAVARRLRSAEDDLDAAEAMLRDDSFVPRHTCLLAQHSAEKALHALLIEAESPVPRHHDLDALRDLLPAESIVRRDHPDLADLTQWAAEPRFPGDWQEATVEDARRAVRKARDIFESALSDLVERGVRVDAPADESTLH